MINDKIKHMAVGFAGGISILPLSFMFDFNKVVGWSFLISSVIFFWKELKDRKTTGFDQADLFCDYLGWFAGYIFSFFIIALIYIL